MIEKLNEIIENLDSRDEAKIESATVYSINPDNSVNIFLSGVPIMSLPMRTPKLGSVKVFISPNGEKIILE